jgi:iron complex outermembrane receptor protein
MRVAAGILVIVTVAIVCTGGVLRPAARPSTTSLHHFDIQAQSLASALVQFGMQSGVLIVAPTTLTEGKAARSVRGDLTPSAALAALLDGSGLNFTTTREGALVIESELSHR